MGTVLNSIYRQLKNHPQYLESITGIAYVSGECVDLQNVEPRSVGYSGTYYEVKDFKTSTKREVMNVGKYDGYPDVEESKLLMYPYSYLEMTAYNGETLDLQLEHFDTQQIQVESWGYLSPESRVAYVVKNYNGDTSLDNALIIKDFPLLPVANNSYESYLSRNKSQIATGLTIGALTTVGGTIGGVATGNALGGGLALYSGASGIAQTLAKQQDAKRQPNSLLTQSGGSGFNIANGIKGFTIKKKMIKPEYRELLTNFWKSYGYKVNKMKQPNLKTREHFNYVKTIGANIKGNVPHDDLEKIRNMFNNGVTLWHTQDVGNYNLSNEEV